MTLQFLYVYGGFFFNPTLSQLPILNFTGVVVQCSYSNAGLLVDRLNLEVLTYIQGKQDPFSTIHFLNQTFA